MNTPSPPGGGACTAPCLPRNADGRKHPRAFRQASRSIRMSTRRSHARCGDIPAVLPDEHLMNVLRMAHDTALSRSQYHTTTYLGCMRSPVMIMFLWHGPFTTNTAVGREKSTLPPHAGQGRDPGLVTTVSGAASPWSRAATLGVSPRANCSWRPLPPISPTTTRPVWMPRRTANWTCCSRSRRVLRRRIAARISSPVYTARRASSSRACG